MARETRSSASKVHFPPNPTPKARTAPENQLQPPDTPRKPKRSRAVRAMLPPERGGPRGALTLEMALTGQDQLNGAAANFEDVAPGGSPSPISTVILNRGRRSGCSLPARLSGGRRRSVINSSTLDMPSSPVVEHKKKVDDENVFASDLKYKSKALMRRIEGQSANAIQSRKRTWDELESEPAPAAKTRKTEPVVEQKNEKKAPVKQSQIPKKIHQTRQRGTRYSQTPKVVTKDHQKAQGKQNAKKQKTGQDPARKAAKKNLVKKAVKKQPARQAKLKNVRAD
ncbi:hypothetical protein L211DRAFT_845766 [Terfezia boudieri ATCC MYA-4762]|uniref:Uncharacterized protein n=1 Tax=Terfezia boudieri ATCC MYA-4762 TaxID=1051890 RepID=A0A3N4M1E7_9PEZI|nr:hypothetical protein L211DRAFT_845766 [Terfezia boudieri ATCC MYA-4762]